MDDKQFDKKFNNLKTHLEKGELATFRKKLLPLLESEIDDILEDHKIEPQSETRYLPLDSTISMLKKLTCNPGTLLRAYNSEHYNDPDEGEFLFKVLGWHKKFPWLKESPPHPYIVSFTCSTTEEDRSDKLPLWKEYGDDGKGCSITMDLQQKIKRLYSVEYYTLKEEQDNSETSGDLQRSSDTEKTELAERFQGVKKIVKLLDEHFKEEEYSERIERIKALQTLIDDIIKEISKVRYLYKDQAYSYEHEDRYVETVKEPWREDSGVTFQYKDSNKRGKLQHYIEPKDLELKGILEGGKITIGPRVLNPLSTKAYIEHLLQKAKVNAAVEISKINYRKNF